jgi:hydrogenase nickel incorporation protein HypA/HybF
LRFSFDTLIKGTDLEPLELEIEHTQRRQRCPSCGGEFDVGRDIDTTCPRCGESRTKLVAGDEMEIVYLEVEE